MNKRPSNLALGLLAVTLLLLAFGLLTVFNVSYAKAQASAHYGNDSYFFAKKQAAAALLGLAGLAFAYRVNLRFIRRLSYPLLAASVALLVLVLFSGLTKFGSSRALPLGPIEFHPAEVAKVAMVLFLALYFSRHAARVKTLPGLAVPIIALGVVSVLVMLEPDLGTASTIALGSMGLFHLAGVRRRHLALLVGVGIMGALVSLALKPYQADRIEAWLHPMETSQEEGYQIVHCLTAIGSGGVSGLGFCNSREKFFYLPASTTDSIMAIVAEELGVFGWGGLLLAFTVFAYCGLRIAHDAPDLYGSLVAGGITLMISVQAIINMAVVTNSIPTTGIPLPFISYGGSSLVVTLTAVGLILNVARQGGRRRREEAP
jgi:cell division protein FtsW